MIKSKLLNDASWKDVLAKNKTIKDNGLMKSLAEIKKLGDDDYDAAQKLLDEVVKLASQLKKSKEVSALKDVTKFLVELNGAAETAMRDVAKDKAEAQKEGKAKAEADAKKREQSKKGQEEEEGEEEESALLTSKMVPLMKAVKRGERMHAMVATAGKQAVVLLSRKPITPARKKLLADELGVSGGVKYAVGHCFSEHGTLIFELTQEAAGMAKKLKLALLQQTNLRFNKITCRGEDGDDADEEEGEEAPEEDGDDEESGGGRAAPGEEAAPPPEPALAAAPQIWVSTRELVESRVDALKDEIRARVADEGGELVDQIDGQLEKLDRILGKLDQRLSASLAVAGKAANAAGRSAALKDSKVILAEYIRYVSSEPLIDHLDKNPFGVKTELKASLSKSLTMLAQAIS